MSRSSLLAQSRKPSQRPPTTHQMTMTLIGALFGGLRRWPRETSR